MKKNYLIIAGVVILVVAIAGAYYFYSSSAKKQEVTEKDTIFEEPSEVIPTVDPSTKVEIKGDKEAVISVSSIPKSTESIEYELSYDTTTGSVEGAIGTIQVEANATTATEKTTFGTCSSGVCRYHSIKGNVKGTFKFTGSYGERILEKEFAL